MTNRPFLANESVVESFTWHLLLFVFREPPWPWCQYDVVRTSAQSLTGGGYADLWPSLQQFQCRWFLLWGALDKNDWSSTKSKGWTQSVDWGTCQKTPEPSCISSSLILPVPSFLFFAIFSPIFTLCLSSSLQPHRRYEMQPVCADLQGQILACYRENVGKTLNCSNIAALYLQCVNDAKQVYIYQTKSNLPKSYIPFSFWIFFVWTWHFDL